MSISSVSVFTLWSCHAVLQYATTIFSTCIASFQHSAAGPDARMICGLVFAGS